MRPIPDSLAINLTHTLSRFVSIQYVYSGNSGIPERLLTWDNGSMALVSVRVSCSVCIVEFLFKRPPVVAEGGIRRESRCTSCWLLLEPDATSDMAESTVEKSAHVP